MEVEGILIHAVHEAVAPKLDPHLSCQTLTIEVPSCFRGRVIHESISVIRQAFHHAIDWSKLVLDEAIKAFWAREMYLDLLDTTACHASTITILQIPVVAVSSEYT